jgi:hypothetical protein
VDWSLGLRQQAPGTAAATITAGIRLDDALRLFLAEQGTKRTRAEDLWSLVMATMRLRLTATSVADLRGRGGPDGVAGASQAEPVKAVLRQEAADLADFYEVVAAQVGPPSHEKPAPVVVPVLQGIEGPDIIDRHNHLDAPKGAESREVAALARYQPRALWIREHLLHLGQHAQAIAAPAEHLAEHRRVPWWR